MDFKFLLKAACFPGALLHNTSNKFICKNVNLKVVNKDTLVTKKFKKNIIKIPIAHGEGRYFADEKTINSLFENNQVIFQYCNENGETESSSNPNGSLSNIAGICNKNRNIFGMMPHPERAAESDLRNTDGVALFKSILASLKS